MRGRARRLAVYSFAVIASFLVFSVLVLLYEAGAVSRSTPVVWEWLAFATSMAWLGAHSIALGRDDVSHDSAAAAPA